MLNAFLVHCFGSSQQRWLNQSCCGDMIAHCYVFSRLPEQTRLGFLFKDVLPLQIRATETSGIICATRIVYRREGLPQTQPPPTQPAKGAYYDAHPGERPLPWI